MNSEPGAGTPQHPEDLDALIGRLEAEAARRRAEPGFPLDAEARVGLELARQSPRPGAASSLDELLGDMAAVAERLAAAPRRRRRWRRRPEQEHEALPDEFVALAYSVTAAVLATARHLRRLELRLSRLDQGGGRVADEDPAPEGG